MEADRKSLETLYANMGVDELMAVSPSKLTAMAKEIFETEVGRRGLLPSAPTAEVAYTAKHLFSVSPNLRAKHFLGFLIIRTFFILSVLGACVIGYVILKYSNERYPIEIKVIETAVLLYCLAALYGIWRLRLWPYIVSICLNIIVSIVMIWKGIFSINTIGCIAILMIIVAAISTWEIRRTLETHVNGG